MSVPKAVGKIRCDHIRIDKLQTCDSKETMLIALSPARFFTPLQAVIAYMTLTSLLWIQEQFSVVAIQSQDAALGKLHWLA